jgi:hypothetical protein
MDCEDPWRHLSDDVLEHVLARLPLSALCASKRVCRRWHQVASSSHFLHLHARLGEQQARLVCYRTNHLVRSKSQAFAYDADSRAWITLPPVRFPDHNYGSLHGACGLVCAIAGPEDNRLMYKLTRTPSSPASFLETWRETPAMAFARHAPVVSVDFGRGGAHKVVVAGGVPDYEPEHMAVEVFDSKTGVWEVYDPLPDDFSGSSSRLWMSGIVCANKLYMSLIHSWTIHVLDLSARQWSPLLLQRPKDLIYQHIMAIKETLIIAGLCEQPGGKAVNIWKLDPHTQDLVQIGSMSGHIFASLERNSDVPTLSFLMDENVLYVSKAYIKDGARVAGKVSLEDCTTEWRVLPSVSSLGYRFDSMCTFCTYINISP